MLPCRLTVGVYWSDQDVYTDKLVAEGVVTAADVTAMSNKIKAHMEEKFALSKSYKCVRLYYTSHAVLGWWLFVSKCLCGGLTCRLVW